MNTHGITVLAKKVGTLVTKNSPTILTGLAVGGLVTTVLLAVRATPKAVHILDDEYGIDVRPNKKEAIKLTWKLYIPAACMGAATVACIIGSNSINQRRNAALATVYGLTEAAFREYKEKVVETLGKSKELKLRDDISAGKVLKNPTDENNIIYTGKGETLCYDSLSGRYFKSDIEQIRRSINDLNASFLHDTWVSLNDLYYNLGLNDIKLGEDLGWDLDHGLVEVTFSATLNEKGDPCLVLEYAISPRFGR